MAQSSAPIELDGPIGCDCPLSTKWAHTIIDSICFTTQQLTLTLIYKVFGPYIASQSVIQLEWWWWKPSPRGQAKEEQGESEKLRAGHPKPIGQSFLNIVVVRTCAQGRRKRSNSHHIGCEQASKQKSSSYTNVEWIQFCTWTWRNRDRGKTKSRKKKERNYNYRVWDWMVMHRRPGLRRPCSLTLASFTSPSFGHVCSSSVLGSLKLTS